MSEVKFKPWIGDRYSDAELYGLKILLVGESHYGDEPDDYSKSTTDVVRWIGQDKRYGFFTKISNLLLNSGHEWLSDKERYDFWNKVAFYNYIQELAGKEARIRPTQGMWKNAVKPFLEVCKELAPDLIVFFGKELSDYIPKIPTQHTYCCVMHPSSSRFSYKNEWPIVENAINQAKNNKSENAHHPIL